MSARRNEPARRRGLALGACVALALAAACATPVLAQSGGTATATFSAADTTDALSRAMDAEDKGEFKRAGTAYREVLQKALSVTQIDGDRIALAMLGFERVMSEQGLSLIHI